MQQTRIFALLLSAASAAAFSPALMPLGDAKARLASPGISVRPSGTGSRTPPGLRVVKGGARLTAVRAVDRSYMTPEQLETLAEIEADLTEIFRKYDKNRDNHLTMEVISHVHVCQSMVDVALSEIIKGPISCLLELLLSGALRGEKEKNRERTRASEREVCCQASVSRCAAETPCGTFSHDGK